LKNKPEDIYPKVLKIVIFVCLMMKQKMLKKGIKNTTNRQQLKRINLQNARRITNENQKQAVFNNYSFIPFAFHL
jgi:hypothetical protein